MSYDSHSHSEIATAVAIVLSLATFLMFGVAFAVAFLPPGHRLQRILAPLIRRLAVTVGLTIMAKPADYMSGTAWPYELAASLVLCWYWWGFISEHLLAQADGQGTATATVTGSRPIDAEPHY